MNRISLPETAHQIIQKHLHHGAITIDATIGNGHDILFLAQQVGTSGHVYGFDIQPQAIAATTKRLNDALLQQTTTLIQVSHADMSEKIPALHHGFIQAIMFNLGYLPGGDKSLITQTNSTLQALNAAIRLLAEKGVLTIMVYPGHPGGDDEAKEVKHWLDHLDKDRFNVTTVHSTINKASAPRLHIVEKR